MRAGRRGIWSLLPSAPHGYGVEKDDISGRIAKLLYPKAQIKVRGFEETQYPDNFFDVAVGNVPFGDYKLYDAKYSKHNFRIHDYFFAKALDKVRPGGIVAFITSKGTLDKANPAVRKYLAERAELLGAIRLPNTAFKDSAGTDVTSDIIFLQKRERKIVTEPDWVHDRADKEFLYDAEENFVDTVHQWLKGKCTPEQLEQEPCEVNGIKDIVYGKSIQTGGSGRNPCRDGTACGSTGRRHGKR